MNKLVFPLYKSSRLKNYELHKNLLPDSEDMIFVI